MTFVASGLKCLVITPVGPGHEALVRNAQASVEGAFRAYPGPFTDVVFMGLPDPDGTHGRSRRRNDGIDYALANGFQWIFFLDADDLMVGDALASVSPYINDFDAVFGLIVELRADGQTRPRPNQLPPIATFADLVRCDPLLSLQMGHFVRTEVAAAIRFDVQMDAGEDFKYYLALWHRFRCTKINRVLFVNRLDAHSTGPRSASPRNWRSAVRHVFEEFCQHNAITPASAWWWR